MEKNQKLFQVGLLEVILLFLTFSGLSGLVLLEFGKFSPVYAIVMSVALTVLSIFLFRFKVSIRDKRFDLVILLIILFGLVIRIQPWMYLEGGQDQGVYVSLSKQYEINGSRYFEDNALKDVPDTLKSTYSNERGGWFALGFLRNSEGKIYSNFYPLHPIMLSVGGAIFGSENRVYILTVFSVISIIFAYLLTKDVSGSNMAGYFAAILISVNPLHLYFSKFPVTEVMTLALNLSSLYYLYLAWKKKDFRFFLFNLLLINVIFYTRLTWIFSLPVYCISILLMIVYSDDEIFKKKIYAYLILLLSTFLASFAFYYFRMPFLYKNFLRDIFDYIPSTIFYTTIIIFPVLLLLIDRYFREKIKSFFELLYKYRSWIFLTFFLIILIISAKNFYTMVFTERYVGTRYDYFWGMAKGGWIVLKDLTISSLMIYVTPLGLLGLLVASFKLDNPNKVMLLTLLYIYLIFNFYIVKYIPYHFYYARYQLSEIIPLMLIFIAILSIDKIWRYLLFIPILLYSIIYIPFISFQGQVGTTPSFFEKVKSTVPSDAVVLYFNPLEWSDNFIFFPLKYYFNIKSIRVDTSEDLTSYLKEMNNVYVLSTVSPEKLPDLKFVKKLNFEKGYFTNAIEPVSELNVKVNNWKIPFCDRFIPEKFCSGAIPILYHKASIDIYMYNKGD